MPAWTADEDERLTELAKKGLSASQIGELMGKTRMAIIGRSYRIRIRLNQSESSKAVSSRRRVANRKPRERHYVHVNLPSIRANAARFLEWRRHHAD